ncbi:MAG: hypothetical protein VXW87_04080 [Pseudomonadota bacterium]|nr:hypothetical protein [Pseudomonadota bacterium]
MHTPPAAATLKQVRFNLMYMLHIISPIDISPLKPRVTESQQLLQEAEIIEELYGGSVNRYLEEKTALRHTESKLSRKERLQQADLCPISTPTPAPAPTTLNLCQIAQSSLAKRRAEKGKPIAISK